MHTAAIGKRNTSVLLRKGSDLYPRCVMYQYHDNAAAYIMLDKANAIKPSPKTRGSKKNCTPSNKNANKEWSGNVTVRFVEVRNHPTGQPLVVLHRSTYKAEQILERKNCNECQKRTTIRLAGVHECYSFVSSIVGLQFLCKWWQECNPGPTNSGKTKKNQ